ncbi:MAG TPA: hypothetical protein VLJ20_08010 [Acetobacteraceae bacterium]|nr:hypothetical protein [Acetobacteraceae bacterium]
MSPALIDAAIRLADALARENQALAALDLPRAAGMLADKQRAADAFLAAQALLQNGAPAAEPNAAAKDVAARLGTLAEENRRLLERAIAVQGRVIGTLARAVRPAALGYGAHGGRTVASRPGAIALSARA